MPGPSAEVWTWEKTSGVKFILKVDIYFVLLGFFSDGVLFYYWFLKINILPLFTGISLLHVTCRNTHTCIWSLNNIVAMCQGEGQVLRPWARGFACEHLHCGSTPEGVGTGLQTLSREAVEKPQPPCLGSEEKADFSSMANTVPKASMHN